ncbi:restriction endonuclease [Jeotgalibacillus campisalis]|uniref:Glucose-6-phosphate isomerase n=1 Tax=Jeotgalibacillus campisalis TaxID=220754 RepID=A0A0C2RZ97_9BACL|nr:restriction endonuclease [Jeotgalibacillus campisalis]KIL47119.1 glucose-6-phosphate isomerase [Jeotgalibacillus campisalis]
MVKNLLTKTKMSKMTGWSEANGRRWVKNFSDFIPYELTNNRIMYTNESLRVMKFLKKMNDAGYSAADLKKIFLTQGVPNTEEEENLILNQKKFKPVHNLFDENIKESIPSSGQLMIPYLELIKDGNIYTASDITEKIVKYFSLSEKQRHMRYENTSDIVLLSRIRGVRYSLKKENYIEEVSRLTYRITDEGRELLNESYSEISEEIEELERNVDPLTVVKEKLDELNNELADNLLKKLRTVHWMKFEDIVVELLTVMGYGDGQVTQRTNDEGLDGVIKEDKLGLDNIYVQAKRFAANNSVGREIVQSFSGALDGKEARKGVFITTSYFTEGAKKYAERLESKKIILIDGIELSKLMISHNVGVDVNQTFIVKAIDFDYFKDE